MGMQFKFPWSVETMIYVLIILAGALMVGYGIAVAIPLLSG